MCCRCISTALLAKNPHSKEAVIPNSSTVWNVLNVWIWNVLNEEVRAVSLKSTAAVDFGF